MRKVSTECAVVITKAAELFAIHLATQSVRTASLRGSRAVRDVDVLHTIHSSDALAFLRMDFPKKALTSATSATVAGEREYFLFLLLPSNFSFSSFLRFGFAIASGREGEGCHTLVVIRR